MRLPRSVRVALKKLSYGGIGGSSEGARVVQWIAPQPGQKVADIGSGFGDFSFRFANAVGPTGAVYAVDTDEDLRLEVARRAKERGLAHVHVVEANEDDPAIPEPVDLVFLASSFHHLPDRERYFQQVRPKLRPDGRVVILEGKPGLLSRVFGHATEPADVVQTLEAAGYRRTAGADLVRWASLQEFVPTDRPD